jgi:hypothetical protein
MKKHFHSGLIAAALSLVVTGALAASLTLSDLPSAVQKTVAINADASSVTDIVSHDDNGIISYDFTTKSKDGQPWNLTVAQDGTLLGTDTKLSDVPPAVQSAVTEQVGKGYLEGIEKLLDEGQTTYRAGITQPNEDERNFTYAEDGTLQSQEVNLNELSPELQTAINTQVADGKLEGIDKTFEDGDTTYETTVIKSSGEKRNFTFGEDATLVSEEVNLTELPTDVQVTINKQLGDGTLQGIDENFDKDDGNSYEATEINSTGQERNFTVGSDGSLLSQEVSLEDASPAVQATISQTIGDGKILEVDRAYVYAVGKRFMHYEIESRKDGKPFDFLVGPKAKFLGMDTDAPVPPE